MARYISPIAIGLGDAANSLATALGNKWIKNSNQEQLQGFLNQLLSQKDTQTFDAPNYQRPNTNPSTDFSSQGSFGSQSSFGQPFTGPGVPSSGGEQFGNRTVNQETNRPILDERNLPLLMQMLSNPQGSDMLSLISKMQPKYDVFGSPSTGMGYTTQRAGQPPQIRITNQPEQKPPNDVTPGNYVPDGNGGYKQIGQPKDPNAFQSQPIQYVDDNGKTKIGVITQDKKSGTFKISQTQLNAPLKTTGKGSAKLVIDAVSGKAKYKYMGDITDADTPLSTQSLNTGEMASTVSEHIPNVRNQIDSLEKSKKLGPLGGRWSEFMAGTYGAGDADYQKLYSDISLIKSGLSKVHFGARGGQQALERFDKILSADKMDKATLVGGLNSVEEWLNGYAKMGGQQIQSDSTKTAPNFDAMNKDELTKWMSEHP